MLVVAKSVKGKEFLYSSKSCHSVSKASAKKICKILNENNYQLEDNQTWFIHEIDSYSNGAIFAEQQKFMIRKGIVTRKYF